MHSLHDHELRIGPHDDLTTKAAADSVHLSVVQRSQHTVFALNGVRRRQQLARRLLAQHVALPVGLWIASSLTTDAHGEPTRACMGGMSNAGGPGGGGTELHAIDGSWFHDGMSRRTSSR